MAGWLRNVVGATLTVTLESRPGDGDELVAVEVAGSRSGRSLVIERLSDRGAAAVCVTESDGTERRRVLPLPSPDRARLLARRAGAAAARPGLRARPAGGLMSSAPLVLVVDDLAALADEAAARIERIALEAPAGGRATIALAGGATPRATYQHLAARCPPWGRVEFFFGDERCVPPDDPGVELPHGARGPARPHPAAPRAGAPHPRRAAARGGGGRGRAELRAAVPGEPWPVLDLVLAGHGPGRPHGLALPRGAGAERDASG